MDLRTVKSAVSAAQHAVSDMQLTVAAVQSKFSSSFCVDRSLMVIWLEACCSLFSH